MKLTVVFKLSITLRDFPFPREITLYRKPSNCCTMRRAVYATLFYTFMYASPCSQITMVNVAIAM